MLDVLVLILNFGIANGCLINDPLKFGLIQMLLPKSNRTVHNFIDLLLFRQHGMFFSVLIVFRLARALKRLCVFGVWEMMGSGCSFSRLYLWRHVLLLW